MWTWTIALRPNPEHVLTVQGLAGLSALRSVDLQNNPHLELPTWSAVETLTQLTGLSKLVLT